jgi:hypothetical protein
MLSDQGWVWPGSGLIEFTPFSGGRIGFRQVVQPSRFLKIEPTSQPKFLTSLTCLVTESAADLPKRSAWADNPPRLELGVADI